MQPIPSRSGTDEPDILDTVPVDDAAVTLFGHDSTSARLEVRVRGRGWRARRALVPVATTLVVAPAVTLIPPHAPWAVAALTTGGFLAWRRWSEEYTVIEFGARCPRCDAALEIRTGARLRFPHPLSCDACGHEPVLKVDRGRLEGQVEGRG